MDIKPFIKYLFASFVVELHSETSEDLQKEIADRFLTYLGQFKDGDLYILERDHLSRLSPYELSEEIPFTEKEIEEYLSYTSSIKLNTNFSFNGIHIHPEKQWAIGGISSVLRDLITGKVTFFTFPVLVEFTPSIEIKYSFSATLSNNPKEGFYLKVNPEYIGIEKQLKIKKYTGYYASEDGSMDASVIINKYNLNFNKGNIIKYIIRAGKKDPSKEIEDLEKARNYIDFEINRLRSV